LDRVERGEEIVITRHGKPVARLAGSGAGIDRVQAKGAADRIRSRASGVKAGPFNWDELKADCDKGRP
jgi:antitoxin (DNA-binding transcriptional repressor) of toxin-antitoxin stability system